MPQHEMLSAVPVLDDRGTPQNFGWSRQPDFFYDPALLWVSKWRISESDRYIVYNPTHTVVFEIRDDGFLGCIGITVISVKDKKRSTQTFQSLLPLGSYEMPADSRSGAIHYRRKKKLLDFVPMEGGVRIIKADIPQFGHNRSLRGELVLSEPAAAESLVCNMPWQSGKSAFRYSRCSPWFTVEGVIQFGTAEIVFTSGDSWGIFDWNRSVRPPADTRYWAAACGAPCGVNDGRLAGFCIGHGSIDSSDTTENAFFVDGRLHKLDQVAFHIPPANWLAPWRFTSNDQRLDMTFTPQQERVEHRRALVFSLARHQVYGSFSGKVILDDGAAMDFHDLTGFAERVKTRF